MKAMRKYWITLLIDAVLTALIAYGKDVLDQTALVNVYHILCDSFFAVGFVTFAAGLLVFSTNEGTFDMLAYGLQVFANAFKKDSVKKYDTFYDYRVAREEKKVPFGFLLICGSVFLAVAFVMYYLYRQCI